MNLRGWSKVSFLAVYLLLFSGSCEAQTQDNVSVVKVSWDKVERISKTTATLQVVVNPPLRRGTPIHDNVFQALADLHADYVRYVPWLPYPKLAVAELEPPKDGKTSWDFSLVDPLTIDFLQATEGHPVVVNFSTIPQWMYKTNKPVRYPDDPNQVTWDYEQGRKFRDDSLREFSDYYARLLAWYTLGGFSDEFGKRFDSGYHFKIPYWEVLNEVDSEHHTSAKLYTRMYDAMASAMLQVQPDMKFVGMALADPTGNSRFIEYFLDHKNHKPGIPLNYISYHFYAVPPPNQTPEQEQVLFFAKADQFLKTVRHIESIRQRLSPETGTMINELGAISGDDLDQGKPGHVFKPIPNSYWNLAGAMYAYLFGELSHIGIDVAGESQLVGYPTQFPSVSMVDWTTGKPNARYWVLKLLRDSFGPGDKIVETSVSNPNAYAFAAECRDGKRRVLLVSKRNGPVEFSLPGAPGAQIQFVDVNTGFGPPASTELTSGKISLNGFAVAVVTLP